MANKREIKYTAAHKVAKSYVLELAAEMRRCGSLININPSAFRNVFMPQKYSQQETSINKDVTP